MESIPDVAEQVNTLEISKCKSQRNSISLAVSRSDYGVAARQQGQGSCHIFC